MTILQWRLQTDIGVVGLILRITLAVLMFPHGVQKVLGWVGGQRFKGTVKHFTDSGIPTVCTLLAIAAELLGSLGLVVGFLTRIAAFGIACVMLVAIATVHWPQGFFMNWSRNQKGVGFEYHLLALGIAVALMVVGGGVWSLDLALVHTGVSRAKLQKLFICWRHAELSDCVLCRFTICGLHCRSGLQTARCSYTRIMEDR
jgi:putative oxidoreductase